MFVPRDGLLVYHIEFFGGRDLGVSRLEVNRKVGLFVPGEAPFVYNIGVFSERPHWCTI